jgi:hypothetical protein
LDDARRIAYLSVAHAHDCELVIRDAYNRVLARELISDDALSGSLRSARTFRRLG